MLKIFSAKLALILVALASCLVSASGPVRITNAPQEDIVEILEHRGGCLSSFHSRKLCQPKHLPVLLPRRALNNERKVPVLEAFSCQHTHFWQSSPPILRGPPA